MKFRYYNMRGLLQSPVLGGDLKVTSEEAFSFKGVVVRRDSDGYGFVQFSEPSALRDQTGVFSREVLVDPVVSRVCRADAKVTGTARPYRAGYRVMRLDPA